VLSRSKISEKSGVTREEDEDKTVQQKGTELTRNKWRVCNVKENFQEGVRETHRVGTQEGNNEVFRTGIEGYERKENG